MLNSFDEVSKELRLQGFIGSFKKSMLTMFVGILGRIDGNFALFGFKGNPSDVHDIPHELGKWPADHQQLSDLFGCPGVNKL